MTRFGLGGIILIIGWLMVMDCSATTHYVATNGAGVSPYTNWVNAATNIQDAVNVARTNAASKVVWVSNGVYYLTNQITIDSTVTVASVNGRNVTIVDGYNYPGKPVTNRCFSLTQNAALDGFTIRNGYSTNHSAGIYASTAIIRNCLVTANIASNSGALAGGIFISPGVVSNCDISSNVVYGASGGGVWMSGGSTSIIANCTIAGNILSAFGGSGEEKGAGIYVYGTNNVISNCMIYGNSITGGTAYGGGVCLHAGASIYNSLVCNNQGTLGGGINVYGSWAKVQNCTIVSNYGAVYGGLYIASLYPYTSYVKNVICYFNNCNAGNYSNFYFSGGTASTGFSYVVNSCIAPTSALPFSAGGYYYANNIQSNPYFVNKDSNDFRLSRSSPCVNAGTNEDWMNGAVDLDGHSRIDRFSGMVDMGCYEYLPQGFMFSAP